MPSHQAQATVKRSASENSRAIVVRLMGGLGNQMFQYAFGRRLALESGREVRFDVKNGFRRDVFGRKLAMDAFEVDIARASPTDIPAGMRWTSPWHRLAKAMWSAVPQTLRKVVYERTWYRYDGDIVSQQHKAAYYFGYWQHEGYFSSIRSLLRQEFRLRAPQRSSIRALAAEMSKRCAISVHVRHRFGFGARGRPVPEARAMHTTCPPEYYRQAVERAGNGPATTCYVFTDDPAWAKANLNLSYPCCYVADLCHCSDAEELVLMASCQHHVISNSSFSWWGAWLGGNPNKVVVAPRRWVNTLPEDAVDVCPRTWIRL